MPQVRGDYRDPVSTRGDVSRFDVKRGPAVEVSEAPQHPYTQVLLSSLPSLDAVVESVNNTTRS